MIRRMLLVILAAPVLVAALATAGCDKPTEEQCRKAVENVRRLTGTTQSDFGADPEAAMRSCRGNASKKSVLCIIEAKTVADLTKCEGEKGEQFFAEEEKKEAEKRKKWEEEHKEDKGGE